jgi:hypothetical protein
VLLNPVQTRVNGSRLHFLLLLSSENLPNEKHKGATVVATIKEASDEVPAMLQT